ncbi:MAG: hypothetical protein EPO06_09420 [Burkholderiaceae bacterium]|nr:MAG: hypothetical protein EPO06_09420 [Burkholderiaceae bacterium]
MKLLCLVAQLSVHLPARQMLSGLHCQQVWCTPAALRDDGAWGLQDFDVLVMDSTLLREESVWCAPEMEQLVELAQRASKPILWFSPPFLCARNVLMDVSAPAEPVFTVDDGVVLWRWSRFGAEPDIPHTGRHCGNRLMYEGSPPL